MICIGLSKQSFTQNTVPKDRGQTILTDASHEHPVCGSYHLLMEEEIWKHAVGFSSWFEVSNKGRCRSLGHTVGKRVFPAKIVNQYNNRGYKTVCAPMAGGKNKIISVHRLVAIAFIPNPENKPHVNHKNFCKSDNVVENLEWMTCAENTRHGLQFYNFRGYNSPTALLDKKTAIEIFNAAGMRKEIAKRFGVGVHIVDRIKYKTSYINIHEEGDQLEIDS